MKRQISILSTVALSGLMVLNNTVDINAAPSLNPYSGVEAETNFGQSGTEVVTDNGFKAVSSIESGDYFIVKDVNFSKGVSQFKVKAKADKASLLEIREGGVDGDVIANLKIGATKGEFKEFTVSTTSNIDGKATIAFVGKMGSFAIDNWTAVESKDSSAKDDDKKTEETKGFEVDPSTGKTGPGPFIDPYEPVSTVFVSTDSKGVEQEEYNGDKVVTSLGQGDCFVVHNVKLDKGIVALTVSVKADKAALLEIRDGAVDGDVIGSIKIDDTKGEYKSYTTKIEESIEGTHAIVFTTKTGEVSIEKWKAMCAPGAKTKDDNNTVKEPTDDSSNSASSSDKTGPGPNVNPYEPVSTGLNFGKSEGTELVDYNGKKVVSSIESGDYFVVNNVDFKNGASTLTVLAKADKASSIEVRDGSTDGALLGLIKVNSTNGEYKSFSTSIKNVDGKHALVFVGKMGSSSIAEWSVQASGDNKEVKQPENPTDNKDKNDNKDTKETQKPEDTTQKPGTGTTLFPYNDIAAGENYGEAKGVEYSENNGKKIITSLGKGDYFTVKDVDFKKGAVTLFATVKSDKPAVVEVRDGGVDGKLLGTMKINNTDGKFETFHIQFDNITGKHTIAFVGNMGEVSVESWKAMAGPEKKDDAGNTGSTTPEKTDDKDKATDTTGKTAKGPDVNPYEDVPTGLNFGETKGTELVEYNGKKVISGLEKGDYFVVNNVKFTKGVKVINVSVKADKLSSFDIKDGSADGEVIGSAQITPTNGEYKSFVVKVDKELEGTHALVFVGKGGSVSIEKWNAMSAPQKKTDTEKKDDAGNTGTTTPEKKDDAGNTGTTTPEKKDDAGNTGTTTPEKKDDAGNTQNPGSTTSKQNLTLTHTVNDWGSGYLVDFRVSNNSGETVNGWKLKIKKDGIKITQNWCMEVKEEGDYYVITPFFWNSYIENGNFISFGIIGQGTAPRTVTYEFVK